MMPTVGRDTIVDDVGERFGGFVNLIGFTASASAARFAKLEIPRKCLGLKPEPNYSWRCLDARVLHPETNVRLSCMKVFLA
jgi:hypothetical protein